MKFRLSTEDTERLGLPEVLEFDWDTMAVAEARVLKKATDIDAMHLARRWDSRDTDAVLAVIWLAARRVGVDLEYAELELNLWGIRAEEETEADERGKGPSKRSATSPRTASRTRRSSGTSAA